MDRASNSVSSEAISRPDLHEALGGSEGEDHGVSGVGSEEGTEQGLYWGHIEELSGLLTTPRIVGKVVL